MSVPAAVPEWASRTFADEATGDVVVYRRRRNTELALVAFALLVGGSGYLLTQLNLTNTLPSGWILGALAWSALGVGGHLAVRWWAPYADPILLPVVLLLTGLGLSMIYRIDQIPSPPRADSATQLLWAALGVACFAAVLAFLREPRVLQRFTYTAFVGGLALLLLPLVPGLGAEINGAQVWVRVGIYSFQPSEVAKIVLVVAFASYLTDTREVLALAGGRFLGIDLPRARDLGPILIMWLAGVAMLVFENDLGMSLLFFGLFVVMLYVATERASWAILGLTLFLAAGWFGYTFFAHVRVRVGAWLNPFADYERNLQIASAQFGYAWGGLFGRGWGLGRPGLTPLAKSDFIAAAIGEEIGILGLMGVVVLYGVLVARGLRTALVAREPFLKLLAAGLSFVMGLQVFAIIGGVTRLLPMTGLTTPFMSQGGSSMVANWIVLALMIVISHEVRRPAAIAAVTDAEGVASLSGDATQVISMPHEEQQ